MAGTTIYVSGCVASDQNGEVICRSDIRAQARKTLDRTSMTRAAAGGTFDDVVKVTLYVAYVKPPAGEHVDPDPKVSLAAGMLIKAIGVTR